MRTRGSRNEIQLDGVGSCEFSGISYRESNMGNSAKLAMWSEARRRKNLSRPLCCCRQCARGVSLPSTGSAARDQDILPNAIIFEAIISGQRSRTRQSTKGHLGPATRKGWSHRLSFNRVGINALLNEAVLHPCLDDLVRLLFGELIAAYAQDHGPSTTVFARLWRYGVAPPFSCRRDGFTSRRPRGDMGDAVKRVARCQELYQAKSSSLLTRSFRSLAQGSPPPLATQI